jgi:hypothetical protein
LCVIINKKIHILLFAYYLNFFAPAFSVYVCFGFYHICVCYLDSEFMHRSLHRKQTVCVFATCDANLLNRSLPGMRTVAGCRTECMMHATYIDASFQYFTDPVLNYAVKNIMFWLNPNTNDITKHDVVIKSIQTTMF